MGMEEAQDWQREALIPRRQDGNPEFFVYY
jgi:hypothetical protein